ncbi:wall-associated receptor kinase-like 10 [Pistacia vera]|uniref:wall-associated receptor kinase-like 10 n=1 Tax=Pistacia vera TaxID=55513 RepID=UPI00126306E9|nr:wall-associated receptor kinase-like 10 [Pistacia vera]
MAVHLLVLLKIILLLWPIRPSTALSCPQNCGEVKIQYPYGTGEGCYLNKGFEVTCRKSSGSPKALLSSINLELLEDTFDSSIGISPGIYMDFMRINVSIPVILLNRGKANISESVNLSGSPFYFSSANTFVAMDCNHYANFSSPNEEFGAGCLSFCTCDPNYSLGCYDFTCSIPPNHKFYYANLSSIYSESILRDCSSAFVVEQYWFESSYQSNRDGFKSKKYVPATLDWGEYNGTCVEPYNSGTTFCNDDNYCLIQLTSGHVCLCKDRRSETSLGCRGILYCNMTGGQNCSKCPPGYEHDHQYKECSPLRSYDDMFIKSPRIKFFVIIGCSAGLGVLLLLMGIWWLYKFIRRRKEMKLKLKFFKRNGGLLLQKHLYSDEGRDIKKTKLFTSEELEKATDNFSKNRILGQGGQGTVYKGMLAEGRIVAVKKSTVVDESKLGEFINEVVILSQVNHRNVVELLGCCLETEVPLLVYEFIPNGNLFQYINDPSEEFPITWELRLRIAIDASSAISYLHSAASIPIYHRDIKSTNLLLDEKYRAKVSDFGTSRYVAVDQTHLTTKVYGSFGYFDPEYFRSSQFTEKSDVYSFGVVLAELLTGQKPIISINNDEAQSLALYFQCAMKENRLFEILDARVLQEAGKEEIIRVANLTKRCLKLNGKKRPTMKEVVSELSRIRGLSGDSTMQQNYEETDFVDGKITNRFAIGSSVVGLSLSNNASFQESSALL